MPPPLFFFRYAELLSCSERSFKHFEVDLITYEVHFEPFWPLWRPKAVLKDDFGTWMVPRVVPANLVPLKRVPFWVLFRP